MYDFLWNNKCDSSEYIYLNALTIACCSVVALGLDSVSG